MPRWFLLLELALSGCSFTLSAPTAHRPRNQPPTCDSGKGMVVADALIATGFGIAGIGEASGNGGNSAVIPFALSAAFIGAALYGNSITSRCRTELAAYGMEATDAAVIPDLTVPPPVERVPAAAALTAAPHLTPKVAPHSAPAPAVAPTPQPAPVPPAAPPADEPWGAFWKVMP